MSRSLNFMRKYSALGFYIFFSTLILSLFLLAYLLRNVPSIDPTSPLPSFLTAFQNNQVSTLNLWFPFLSVLSNDNLKKPEVLAKSALIYDLTTNRVLFEKNANEKLPIASLTKIMTAIIALENQRQDDKYTVDQSDLVGEDVMGLSVNETLSLEELTYGLMLNSGNDSAETIANNYRGGREAFIKAMNDKARALGLKNTNFTNPTGLEDDGNQYSTPYDLLVITRYALNNFPLFRRVASTFQYQIPQTPTHKAYFLENETSLLTTYPGVKGVKTGYTDEAGPCLVTYLEYKGRKIIGIILNSENRRQEMKDLLDYSLRTLGVEPPKHS